MTHATCRVCGCTTDPRDLMAYDFGWRCRDTAACRDRRRHARQRAAAMQSIYAAGLVGEEVLS